MQIKIFQNRFLKNNIYLLLTSLLLLSISFFTKQDLNKDSEGKNFTKKLQKYIYNAEENFATFVSDTTQIKSLVAGTAQPKFLNDLLLASQHIFIYKNTEGFTQLSFWNTQHVLPDEAIIKETNAKSFARLSNGFYFVQKIRLANISVISLLPIKRNYIISNDYLKNEFLADPAGGKFYDIVYNRNKNALQTRNGQILFSLKAQEEREKPEENTITLLLRILALILVLRFIHLCASFIYLRQGLFKSIFFLVFSLLTLRVILFIFPAVLDLRQFELFDPAVYGSDRVLRSLGDLLLNSLIVLWVTDFIKNRLKGNKLNFTAETEFQKWFILIAVVFTILFATYISGNIIRSLVSDSQISFDVINFFSLDIYSVTGFLVLCSVAITYYYFCRLLVFILVHIFPAYAFPFFISIAAGGLLLLSFRIGSLSGGFELYQLLWLLLFLLLIKIDLSGFISGGAVVSRMMFRIFFFSLSVASVIFTENRRKEMRSRQHYAELIAAKTDPMSGLLLNTMLTELRPDMLASNFDRFAGESTAARFRDSLIDNNLKVYRDKYDTKIMAYDSLGTPLYNSDPVSYNTMNGIINTQAKLTSVKGLYYYDAGYDKLNYLARRVIRDHKNNLLGYVFIVMSPRNFEPDMLYPELFNRGKDNSIENSTEYAYAIYEKEKLISSHNNYTFYTRYPTKDFEGQRFLSLSKNNYSELWFNAGSEKYIVIVKENRIVIELITLVSYIFCAFLLGSALSWFLSFLLRSRGKLFRMKKEIQLSIRQQVHTTIIFFSVLSFIIIGIATILFFITRYEKNVKETLNRTIRIMANDLKSNLTKADVQSTIFQNAQGGLPAQSQKLVNRLSEVHGQDVNLYSLSGDLKASSIPLPYIKGILSTKMDPHAFYRLNHAREIMYLQKESIGKLEFVSIYIPVTDSAGADIAYLNIPYFTSQSRLKAEISNFLVTIINLNAFIFLIAGMVSLIITNRITRSFSVISEKMKRINLGKRNEPIQWERNDEIGALVKEYNRMLAKLDESAAVLARTERESAWQEMAKQIAHEIKNPLTPMKLSMQFLQRSIESGAPNIKELGAKVSATLVEQIDYLSNIAGEFSRFANIENAKPEVFNLNDALRSVQQLYEGNDKILFEWTFAPDPVLITADKTHINRILTNLILNALQSVEQGRVPHIRINEKLTNKTAEIRITDNGTGILEDLRSKIFTPNFTTKSSGTGLGLAMCLRMAHRAGGDIRFKTSAAGSTFFVTLPLSSLSLQPNKVI